MAERREALRRIVAENSPVTVRQVFYQATVHGIVEKSEAGYGKVQLVLAEMRRTGMLPYEWIVDNTRWVRRPRTFANPEEAIEDAVQLYRKSLWAEADVHVEIWLEKDALSGVVYPVTSTCDVPLMVARGYSSLSFLHEAATAIRARGRPTFLYHLGDFDPSGVNAAEKIAETLRSMAPDVPIRFERVAVSEKQITDWRLPTRPTKRSDSRAKAFGEISVELDAIPPGRLRALVTEVIGRHLDQDRLEALKAAEQADRRLLAGLSAAASRLLSGRR